MKHHTAFYSRKSHQNVRTFTLKRFFSVLAEEKRVPQLKEQHDGTESVNPGFSETTETQTEVPFKEQNPHALC